MRTAVFVVLTISLFGSPARADGPAPVQVMILGTYHLSNPKHDLHNVAASDVTTPLRQAELAELAARLERFKPTRVAVEAMVTTADLKDAAYHAFKPADLLKNRNEITQIGFRIARDLKVADVYGIDEQSDTVDYFPYGKLQDYATHAGGAAAAMLTTANQKIEAQMQEFSAAQQTQTISTLLARMNEPARCLAEHEQFYYQLLALGDATNQPGAELNAAWYLRNAKIFAKLTQIAKPGDRVLVVFGAGHAYWLRHFVAATPGFQLVEPNDYLTAAK
jgi:Family of unknown function (DUF5694)